MIRTLISLPAKRRSSHEPRSNQPWTAAEDRKLLRAVERAESRKVQPWQAKPLVDWIAIARRHQRSCLAIRSRVTLLRAAPRIAHGIGRAP
jgi:hypothetical protein